MKYYKKIEIEDDTLFKKFRSNYLVAKILGVNPSYISSLENGKIVMSEKSYLKMKAKLLNYLENNS